MSKIVSSKRREQLGTGEGGHTSSCAVSQAGARLELGVCQSPGGAAQGGHSPGGGHPLPYSVPVLQLGFVLSNFPSFIPRPCSAFRASQGIPRPQAFPARRSLSPPRPEVFSALGASPMLTGARTRLCLTSLLVTVGGAGRCL